MGITIFKIFIWGGILSYIRWEIMFSADASPYKQNFRPYIRGYTSPNEKFEYSYPLNEGYLQNSQLQKLAVNYMSLVVRKPVFRVFDLVQAFKCP